MGSRSNSGGPSSKVARLIDEYGLEGIGAELETRWTAEDDRMSLRGLADYFNRELLGAALEDQQVEMLAGEVDNMYEILTDDSVTSGHRTQAVNRLDEQGVDAEQLLADFVSRQAIHTYLKKHRDAEYETENREDAPERRLDELQRLRNRLSAVAERALSSLRKSGYLTLGEYHVLVSVQVQCSDCGKQFDVSKLVDRRGCDCS